jgi:flagellar motor protein MotB
MARAKEPEAPADIPSWLMTFSDVITLLMTFFILLLTFATNEPEKFERIQVSMFGGGGATGMAAEAQGPLDHDALLLRQRQRSGRITQVGSEMPPIHSDAVYESLSKGIAGLEEDEMRDMATQHGVRIPWSLFVTSDGDITPLGRQHLKMIAKHMRRQPIDADFLVADATQFAQAQQLASYLFEKEAIQPGRLGVGSDPDNADRTRFTIVLTRPLFGKTHGN